MLQQFDDRNTNIKVWVGDKLVLRENAKVSVFDSSVQGGDAVWEGLRIYNGKVFCLDEHLLRLQESAHTLAFSNIPSNEDIKKAIFKTLKANKMNDGVHVRLTLTRGIKITSGMDPRLNTKGCTLIVLAEYKAPVYADAGIRLVTSNIRRNTPLCLDSKIHHANLLNNIMAKIEANVAGVDDALMLDINGFVAETNATNIFMIKNGELHTPNATACLPGITRGLVIQIAKDQNIKTYIRDISLTEFYNADEVFVTGTMGELTQVTSIDNRSITAPSHNQESILIKLNNAFYNLTKASGEPIPC